MGEAKKRGSFEERKKLAVERDLEIANQREQLREREMAERAERGPVIIGDSAMMRRASARMALIAALGITLSQPPKRKEGA
jgi:hypothetical protein